MRSTLIWELKLIEQLVDVEVNQSGNLPELIEQVFAHRRDWRRYRDQFTCTLTGAGEIRNLISG